MVLQTVIPIVGAVLILVSEGFVLGCLDARGEAIARSALCFALIFGYEIYTTSFSRGRRPRTGSLLPPLVERVYHRQASQKVFQAHQLKGKLF